MGEIFKAVGKIARDRRAAKQAEKLQQNAVNVAERTRRAGSLSAGAAEVQAAKKYAGKKGFKRGAAIGVLGTLGTQFALKNKVDVTTSPRKKTVKKKVAKKKPLKKGTARYSF